jgi:type II secretory pathway component PulK
MNRAPMDHSHPTRSKPRRRRGAVMFAVLVSLVVVTALVAGWTSDGLSLSRKSRDAEQRLQADWLAEAGLDRAAARLAVDHNYSGETWTIAPAELSSADGGRVEIHVAATGASRRISVAADYPADPQRRCRIRKEIVLGP